MSCTSLIFLSCRTGSGDVNNRVSAANGGRLHLEVDQESAATPAEICAAA